MSRRVSFIEQNRTDKKISMLEKLSQRIGRMRQIAHTYPEEFNRAPGPNKYIDPRLHNAFKR